MVNLNIDNRYKGPRIRSSMIDKDQSFWHEDGKIFNYESFQKKMFSSPMDDLYVAYLSEI